MDIMDSMTQRRRNWLFRIAFLTVLALFFVWPLLALAIVLTWATYLLGIGTYYQGYQGPSLERGLGFKHGKLYQRVGRFWHSSLAIRSVTESGILARAGFRTDDVLPDWPFTDFFRHLHRHRGRRAEFEVVDGADGSLFAARARRTLQFAVPTVSEAPPTPSDAVRAIVVWLPLILFPAGLIVGVALCQAVFPGGPLWLQILIVWCVVGVGLHLALCKIPVRNEREAG
jgi:hypothetical protein